ncbi:hypothetical protein Tco_0169608 [Tanacetum coccineum]
MKDIFEELEAEVDQNVVNTKHDEIERKNLLIANDNLIVDCLSKEVVYIATNSALTVVDGDVGYDDDSDGEVAVMVVLVAVGQQP